MVERRGTLALVVGRATPGLRTVTVLSAGSVRLPYRRALPALVAGSTVFLQGHLLLGLTFGAPIRAALATGTARIVAGGTDEDHPARTTQTLAGIEGVCPVCLLIGAGLTRFGATSAAPTRTGPAAEAALSTPD